MSGQGASWISARRRVAVTAIVPVALLLTTAVVPVAASPDATPDEGIVAPGGEFEPTEPEPQIPRRPFDRSEPPLLGVVASGDEALDLVGDRLAEVAARNGMSPDDLARLLSTDATAHLDVDGILFYVDPAPDPAALDSVPATAEAPFPYEDTFLLNSKPGSKRTIYLDFNGHTLPADNGWMPTTYTAPAFDTDGDPADFSNEELDAIQGIWQRVAEDFAPFDVNVTTQDPGFAAINRSSTTDAIYGTRAVTTSENPAVICGSCGGIAYIGVFDEPSFHAFYQPAWCFNIVLPGTKTVAECISHEVGHNLGLDHDGEDPGDGDYYLGHEPWAPIMGIGYDEPVVQFSKGEYANATNTEDDFAVMAGNGLPARVDDHTNSTTTATVLTSTRSGIVASLSDHDLMSFHAPTSGEVTFVATPASVSPNLDIELRLYSASLALLATSTPTVAKVDEDTATGMDGSITHTLTGGITYFLQVSPGEYLTASTGYTTYGSIGQYELRAEGMVGLSTCDGLLVTMQGTTGAETITGTSGPDVIDGLEGDDVINGLGGDDIICGGDGADTVDGGSGTDTLFGSAGADTVDGGIDPDELWGDAGADVLDGGDGIDTLNGGDDADSLEGGDGNDTVNGDLGDDELGGGEGNDTINGAGGGDDLSGGAGKDTLNGGDGTDTLGGGDGADTLNGNGGADTLNGNAGNDALRGGDGTDTLNGGIGADSAFGGNGLDELNGGDGGDTLNGDASNDELRGNAGADRLNGGVGIDALYGGDGIDTLAGGSGDDFISGDGGNDQLRGGQGKDLLKGVAGNDGLFGDGGDDVLNGGDGADTLNGGPATDVCNGQGGVDGASSCETKTGIP